VLQDRADVKNTPVPALFNTGIFAGERDDVAHIDINFTFTFYTHQSFLS
jgi:hypothetical protein